MSRAESTRESAEPLGGGRAMDADLRFLSRWAGPLGLVGRAMLAYIFVVEGVGKIANYSSVVGYMQANGVDGRLLPLVILTELGGGLLVLIGFKTRWAAIALSRLARWTKRRSRRSSQSPKAIRIAAWTASVRVWANSRPTFGRSY